MRVLDHGEVRLLDVMGDDRAVVDAARISFRDSADNHSDADNRNLIRYLMRHGHLTPFEMCEAKFYVKVPMDCWRQWVRHRTASINEASTRYKPACEDWQSAGGVWRLQSTDNKQGSNGEVRDAYLDAREAELHGLSAAVYRERLEAGVAKEQARKDLPLSTYTEAIWKCDLRNLLHFLALRLDPHAQAEIRAYATAISTLVRAWVPHTWEAFRDYRLEALTLTRLEVEQLRALLAGDTATPFKGREGAEWKEKLDRLLTR